MSPAARRTTSPGAWAAAGAACTGLAWFGGHLIAALLLNVELYHGVSPDQVGGVALLSAGIGAVAGLLVGVSAGWLFGRALTWGLLVAAAGAAGGAVAPYAALAGAGSLPPAVSTSLAWAAVGLLTGLAAGLVVRRADAVPEPEERGDERPARALVTTTRITDPDLRERVRSLLRVLPLFVASVGSLVSAGVVTSPDAVPGLLAAGAVGLCAAGALCDRPRR
ncbi:MAG: hypothetical protein C0501_31065 [Isosphaera sp.]|nr:hypothetical protein [Isosphaera sp.]